MPFNDTQGAMASLPSFQAGLFVALAVVMRTPPAWRPIATGVAALGLLQVAAFAALHAAASYTDLAPQIRDVRAWAIAAPVVVMFGVITRDRTNR
jgi:peptidoglycan/LPS O-acetylase OafA/YrhL